MLKLVASLDLSGEAAAKGVDLFKTLCVYNFGFWFDGREAKVVLDLELPAVALVSVNGAARIYAPPGSGAPELEERLLFSLGLRESLEGFYAAAAADPLLSAFAREWRGWRLRSCDLWWALVTAVCQQNASFRQGWGMLAKLIALYRRRVELKCRGWLPLPPIPCDILAEPGKLREAGLGYRSETVLRIAEAVESGALPNRDALAAEPVERAEAILRRVKGVASYTARLALALALRRYELPPIDRWVRAIAARAYGVEERAVEAEWRRRWGGWSALAAVALTVALDAAPLSKALAKALWFLPHGVVVEHEAALKLIDSLPEDSHIAIGPCVCKKSVGVREEPYYTDMVIMYGAQAYKLAHPEEYKNISKEEAKELLKQFKEHNLIHEVFACFKAKSWAFVICNCDPRYCVPTRSYIVTGDGVYPGPLFARVDADKCAGAEKCGVCLKVCPFGAVETRNGKSAVRADKCMGCGICVYRCPNKARELVPRESYNPRFLPIEHTHPSLLARK